jgi:hypothetical protein
MPIAFQTIHIRIKWASPIGTIESGKFFGVAMTQPSVGIARTLSIADFVLVVAVLICYRAQILSH